MNLSYLNTSDRQLNAMSSLQDSEGAAVRKEIIRRKSIGYWDGSLKTNTNEAPVFVESVIIASSVGRARHDSWVTLIIIINC